MSAFVDFTLGSTVSAREVLFLFFYSLFIRDAGRYSTRVPYVISYLTHLIIAFVNYSLKIEQGNKIQK